MTTSSSTRHLAQSNIFHDGVETYYCLHPCFAPWTEPILNRFPTRGTGRDYGRSHEQRIQPQDGVTWWLRIHLWLQVGAETHLEVSINGGTPIALWFISWKIPLEWMMTGGSPISGNHLKSLWISNSWMVAIFHQLFHISIGWPSPHIAANFCWLFIHMYLKLLP